MSEDYDVVIDVLQKHYDALWKMTKNNMTSEFMGMGIMDDIRLEQMDQLKQAITLWERRKETLLQVGKWMDADKGYSEGTMEAYLEFKKNRNDSF